MKAIDLSKYGITGVEEIVYNPSYEELFEAEMDPTLEGSLVSKSTIISPPAKP